MLKNINLQIKNIKTCFYTFFKTFIKNILKNIFFTSMVVSEMTRNIISVQKLFTRMHLHGLCIFQRMSTFIIAGMLYVSAVDRFACRASVPRFDTHAIGVRDILCEPIYGCTSDRPTHSRTRCSSSVSWSAAERTTSTAQDGPEGVPHATSAAGYQVSIQTIRNIIECEV